MLINFCVLNLKTFQFNWLVHFKWGHHCIFSDVQWLVDFPVAVLNHSSEIEFKIPWSKCVVLFWPSEWGQNKTNYTCK